MHQQTNFNNYASEYDRWFDENHFAYQSEIEAIRRFIPDKGLGVEIGAGTGRFSTPFSITVGVEPSDAMAEIASSRGITVHRTFAEDLPFDSEHFDYALMVNTICFVEDTLKAIQEIFRILIPGGKFILAIIDKNSKLGLMYESKKASSMFYKDAVFYSPTRVLEMLCKTGFSGSQIAQTIFTNPRQMTEPDPVKEGYGEGAFVVIGSVKGKE